MFVKYFREFLEGLLELKNFSKLISIEAITPNPPIWRPGFDSRISYLGLEYAWLRISETNSRKVFYENELYRFVEKAEDFFVFV